MNNNTIINIIIKGMNSAKNITSKKISKVINTD
jgi:hypothetical protein